MTRSETQATFRLRDNWPSLNRESRRTMSRAARDRVRVDLWPIYERDGNHAIGYIASTDDIAGLPYPRIGEVYRTPHGWAAWAMGMIFGDEEGPRSVLGFRSRHDAIQHLVSGAEEAVAKRRTAA